MTTLDYESPTAADHRKRQAHVVPTDSSSDNVEYSDEEVREAQYESSRAMLAQILQVLLHRGISAKVLRRIFSRALLDAARSVRNEKGLTIKQAAEELGVRYGDLANAEVDDQLDVLVLGLALLLVNIAPKYGRNTARGCELSRTQVMEALDAEGGGPWVTLQRTFRLKALNLVIERTLKADGVEETSNGILVPNVAFFRHIKVQEAIGHARQSIRAYAEVMGRVLDEMQTVRYRAALRRGEPRTESAAYAVLSVKWRGGHRDLIDSLRKLADSQASDTKAKFVQLVMSVCPTEEAI
jgi:hypothetical protein